MVLITTRDRWSGDVCVYNGFHLICVPWYNGDVRAWCCGIYCKMVSWCVCVCVVCVYLNGVRVCVWCVMCQCMQCSVMCMCVCGVVVRVFLCGCVCVVCVCCMCCVLVKGYM